MMHANQFSGYEQRQAHEQFCHLQLRAVWRQRWSALTGRHHHLVSLHEVQKSHQVQERSHAGLQVVLIAKIRGSEGRCTDFDADFRPLKRHTQDRWVSVAVAYSQDVALPAVELVHVGDRYFVRDGHHRISVAKMRGQLEIEAMVTVWRGAVLPEPASGWMNTQAQAPVTPQRLKLMDRLVLNTGKWLVAIGTKLQARHTAGTGAPVLQGS
jgi:hypothetical protein